MYLLAQPQACFHFFFLLCLITNFHFFQTITTQLSTIFFYFMYFGSGSIYSSSSISCLHYVCVCMIVQIILWCQLLDKREKCIKWMLLLLIYSFKIINRCYSVVKTVVFFSSILFYFIFKSTDHTFLFLLFIQ